LSFSGGILAKILAVTSSKFPMQAACFANMIVPRATTLYKIGILIAVTRKIAFLYIFLLKLKLFYIFIIDIKFSLITIDQCNE